MKKKVVAMFLAAVMALSLVACGNKTDNGGSGDASTAATSGGHRSSAASRSSTNAGRPDTGSRSVFPVSCSAVTVCFRPQTDMVIFNRSPPPWRAPCPSSRRSSK